MTYYNHLFGPRYKSLGFSKKGKLFYRVTNDIVQSFQIERNPKGGGDCTIWIGFYPLCEKRVHLVRSFDGIDLGSLIYSRFHIWYYEQNDDDRKRVVDDLFELCEQYMVPLFEKVTDCQSYYGFLLDYEHRTLSVVKAPEDKLVLNHYLLCVKLGKYEEAAYHLRETKKHNLLTTDTNLKMWRAEYQIHKPKHLSPEFLREYEERFTREDKQLEDILEKIVNRDTVFLDCLISDNEEYSREMYRSKKRIR